jgi:hypothetical protein
LSLNHANVSESNCNVACTGNVNEICGGNGGYFSVFSMSITFISIFIYVHLLFVNLFKKLANKRFCYCLFVDIEYISRFQTIFLKRVGTVS